MERGRVPSRGGSCERESRGHGIETANGKLRGKILIEYEYSLNNYASIFGSPIPI